MRLVVESKLVDRNRPVVLNVQGDPGELFLDAAIHAHIEADPSLRSHPFAGEDGLGRHCELEYVEHTEAPWIPVTMYVPDDTTIGTVQSFFGDEVTSERPQLSLIWRAGRGGDGFYAGEVTVDLIRIAFEFYGYFIAGRELARFSARRRARVPFEEVEKWKNSGTPSPELLDYIRTETERSPQELELLLQVDRLRCVELLRLAGYRPLTGDGQHWYRPRDTK